MRKWVVGRLLTSSLGNLWDKFIYNYDSEGMLNTLAPIRD